MRLQVLPALLFLAFAFLPQGANAQFRPRGISARPSATPVSEPGSETPTDTTRKEPTVEELLRRLDELESRAAKRLSSRGNGLALLLEETQLASTNYYGPDGIPYFVARLVVINLSEQPVTIRPRDVILISDGREHTLPAALERLSGSVVQFGDQTRVFDAPPDQLDIPAGGSGSTWLLYADLDAQGRVPAMTLRLPHAGGTEELDINSYQDGVLGLRTELMGPQNCAALLTITGELNSVNAATLADELDRLGAGGVARIVIAWGESAVRPTDQLFDWLRTGTSQEVLLQYSQLPPLPASIRELHLVRPPGGEVSVMYGYGQLVPVHASVDEAMPTALRTAFEAVPRDMLRRELLHGHRLSRAAALTEGGARLRGRDLSLVIKACKEEDHLIRTSALTALRHFHEPAAIEQLVEAAQSPDPALAQAALDSLAGSRFSELHKALSELLPKIDPQRRTIVVNVLAQHPRPEWIPILVEYFRTGDPPLRLQALRALVRLGHPDLFQMLAEALRSDDEPLRTEAFAQLAARTDSASEELATEYALKLLKKSPPDETTYSILGRTRDARAIPLLLEHLDAAQGGQDSLIVLLAQIGGTEIVPELLARYPRPTPADSARVLEVLFGLKAPEVRELAIQALATGTPELVNVATRILTAQPDGETVPLLKQALEKAENLETWTLICNALGNVGDDAARKVLLEARRSDDPHKRAGALNALQRIKYASPAYQYADLAQAALRDKDAAKAEKLFDLAISFDSAYSEAFSQRGHLRLTQEKLSEAVEDFERALEIDPYDSLAVTGRALVAVLQGKPQEGVRQIRNAAPQFTGDALFEYNAACVYGRAIEKLDALPDASPELREEYAAAGIQHLKTAVQLGFGDFDHLTRDPDLESFHGMPAYEELLERPDTEPREMPRDDGEL